MAWAPRHGVNRRLALVGLLPPLLLHIISVRTRAVDDEMTKIEW